jgi:hypothetical protein
MISVIPLPIWDSEQAMGILKECFHRYESFNLLDLEYKTRLFYFLINQNGEVVKRKLDVSVTEYHVIPRTGLPDSFKEFE